MPETIHNTWKEFLLSQGAKIENDCVIDFGNPDNELSAALESPTLSPLSDFTLLEVSGADRLSFLHGQLINDKGEVSFEYRPVHMFTLTDEVDVFPPKKRVY